MISKTHRASKTNRFFKTNIAVALLMAGVGVSSQSAAIEVKELNGTKFTFGGYIKAEGIVNKPDTGDRTFESSLRQSRLNVAAVSQVQEHRVKAFVEIDFWDDLDKGADASYAPRLRHAYLGIDNFTIGQTWSGQFFAAAPLDVEMLNMFGLGTGTLAGTGAMVRPDLLVHYHRNGLRLTLQDPAWNQASYPDMVAAYTYRFSGQAVNLAVTGREVDTLNDDSKFGAAVSLASKFQLAGTTLSLSGFSGQGAGVYAGWGYLGAAGANQATDVNAATNKLITTTGFSAGITQKFTPTLRGTVRYGQVTSNHVNVKRAPDDTFKMVNVNLIYTYLPNLDFGIEWRDQNAQNTSPATTDSAARPKGQQVELMAMYKFST